MVNVHHPRSGSCLALSLVSRQPEGCQIAAHLERLFQSHPPLRPSRQIDFCVFAGRYISRQFVLIRVCSCWKYSSHYFLKIFLTAGGNRRRNFFVDSIAGRWVLAGKDSFNRWRGWRDSGAGLLDWGCGCFQSFFGPSPGVRGVKPVRENAPGEHH